MPKALNQEDWTARAEAYQEAAEFLDLAWTNADEGAQQANYVGRRLWAESKRCRRIAATFSEAGR